ncbi:melanoma antigen preferentially expressed in tumors-like [Dipodomys merriami]|uniref:melanoma antigen preferentially expressed in tumors-like n=1 Tax=Dipodomys merriami TaxID=94247 RepID=UPI003855FA21
MSTCGPPTLLELAIQNLLKDDALVIAALEELPVELFPPLFMAAYTGKHNESVKRIVQAWPFPCLPLGSLVKGGQTHQENFQAVLNGLDALLAEDICPRQQKLQVLDLCQKTTWSCSRNGMCSLSQAILPLMKVKVDGSSMGAKEPRAPLKVFIDLYLSIGSHDEWLTSLIEKAKQWKGLLHLYCNKLSIFALSMQNMKVLKVVRLYSVQDLELICNWKLSVLGKLLSLLPYMGKLHRLFLSQTQMSQCSSWEEEEQFVETFSSQLLSLHHLQELHLESISSLEGSLCNLLRCLKSPLKILSLTNCLLLESDLMNLSKCPSTRQLRGLCLNRVLLMDISSETLEALLENVSSTLQVLSLEECGIMNLQLTAILPALRHCSQLTTFSFSGNPISINVLLRVLRHTIGLTKLRHVRYPAPLEFYEHVGDGLLATLHAKLMQMLQELGRSDMEWLSGKPCPHREWPFSDLWPMPW